MEIENPFGVEYAPLSLPQETEIIRLAPASPLSDVEHEIEKALSHPIASEPFDVVARRKREGKEHAKACIVVSDNTRPVPYKGEEGILLPLVKHLLSDGYRREDVLILIANGTHRAMSNEEIARMVDSEVLSLGIRVENHDCHDQERLTFLGKTERGTEAWVDSRYVDADLKIATGLVESHFMAGASGGRKAICPGLVGIKTTHVFHGPQLMASPMSRDLLLAGNPVHEESLAVAKMAGVDFLCNVTLNGQFHVTGLFFGDLEKAHEAAVAHIRDEVGVRCERAYDVVVTHGGFVGVNHYQCAKCAVASLGILKQDGYLVSIAHTTDQGSPIGGASYQKALEVLTRQGAKGFQEAIVSPTWKFLPEQWQVQQWAKLFQRIPMDHFFFYSPQITREQWKILPGIDGGRYLPRGTNARDGYRVVVEKVLEEIRKRAGKPLSVAYIADGPYVIPRNLS